MVLRKGAVMTGLYVHIPFCVKKCHYCNFVITGKGPGEKHELFLSALEKEAGCYAPEFEQTSFDTLYIGGGTPSTLSRNETERLFLILRKNFTFKEGVEICFEANPGDVDKNRAKFYRSIGITRVSLGAQSFNEQTLKRINRAHGPEEIGVSFEALREANFKNINLDLILSLPDEKLSDVRRSLEKAVSLGSEHISIYELTIEEKTVFGALSKQGALNLPSEEEQTEILSYAREYLKANGFSHYELLNYAKPGFESRHNLLYWANEEYLGLGPGAFSYFSGRRFRNSASFDEYMTKINRGDWSAFEEEILTPEKKEIESLLLALRRTEGADTVRFEQILSKHSGSVDSLREKGLLIKEGSRLRLTPRGQFFAETVFTELSLVS